jgi:hypothetical protein
MTVEQPFSVPRFLLFSPVYVLLSLAIVLSITSTQPALSHLLDFGSFIAAGRAAAAGKNPYASDSSLVYRVQSQDTAQVLPSPNLNPPLSVLLFMALSSSEPMKAVSGWRILTALLFAAGLFVLTRFYPHSMNPMRIVWAISLAGFWHTIALGQIYAPLFVLAIGVWILCEREAFKLAGLMLGILIAIKPNFVLWLALLGFAGYTTAALSAAITALVVSLLPILTFGAQIYQQWLKALSDYPSSGLQIAGNSSFQSLTARFGSSEPGLVICALFIGLSLYFVYRHKKSLNKINALGIAGSLLISPFSWVGYTILVLPIFFSKSKWNWQDTVSAAAFSFPYVLILYFFQKSFLNSILFGWLYGWGLLLIVAGLIFDRDDRFFNNSLGNQVG